jgi:molybdopterin molybdotransferase
MTVTPPLLSIDEARSRVLSVTRLSASLGTERVDIDGALGRILAAEVEASGDTPPFDSSAMDGYALPTGDAQRLRIVGESRAGAPYDGSLEVGETVRISTGAAVPAGTFAVIRQEDTEVAEEGGIVNTLVAVRSGANIRRAGEDMRSGMTVLKPGIRLGPSQLGAAVAAGAGSLQVTRRPRVAVVCTGDELRAPGEPLEPGQIHNSNAPMLRALATASGAEATTSLTLPDDPEQTEAALAAALEMADVVIISGGVSVGPHDHVKPALHRLGVTEHFWGVKLQPGKPTWFGSRGPRLVFALPGNPVSAAVTFSLFASPALRALQGAGPLPPPAPEAVLDATVPANPRRDQAIRVRLEHRADGPHATPTGAQGSHLFSSLLLADALAVIPAAEEPLPPGTRVRLERAPG